MSTQLAEYVTIGIPFSLNWTNIAAAADVDAKTVSSSADQSIHRRTIAMSNASFVMELATNSICSFTSDLFSDGTLCFDSHILHSAVVAVPDIHVSRGSGTLIKTSSMDYAFDTFSSSVYRDPPYDGQSTDQGSSINENVHTRPRSIRRRNHSTARAPSRLFDVLECDAFEEGMSYKLKTSRTSSRKSNKSLARNAMWSTRRGIPFQTTVNSFVLGPTEQIPGSITSSATSKSTMQSRDLWQYNGMKGIHQCGSMSRSGNWRSSWNKVFRCCCAQPQVKH